MSVDLAKHFSFGQLLKYSLPSIAMTIFTSIYVIVDGLFVSNVVGKTALAAINFAWPPLLSLGALGFMFGTGGAALAAKTLGEKDPERANRYFSMVIISAAALGIVLSIACAFVLKPLFEAMGASGELLDMALVYGYISIISLPAYILGNAFQMMFPAAGKPKVGLYVMLAAGFTNIILDALFIPVLGWGVAGAAVATVTGELISGIAPIFYFARKNSSYFRLAWTRLEFRPILKACTNGISELISEVSVSIVAILFNIQLLRLIGEDGVAAFGVISYMELLFIGVFIGFSIGTDPLMSYQYGAKNRIEMQSLFKKSLSFMVVSGIVMAVLSQVCAPLIAQVFAGYDQNLFDLTVHGLRIYTIYTLFVGIGIYGSALFTALNNGLVSGIISALRTLVFEAGMVMMLPMVVGAEGIWFATPIADFFAAIVAILLMLALGKRYGFLRNNDEKLLAES